MPINPQDIENRSYYPVLLRGGLNLTKSKYDVFSGSLQDCLNYESSDQGYTRSQGLLLYDGTHDSAVEDMWYITTTTAESTLTGTVFDVLQADGTTIYAPLNAKQADGTIIGVSKIILQADGTGITAITSTGNTGLAEFIVGGTATWATGSGTIIYWESVLLPNTSIYNITLGLVNISGDDPVAGDTLVCGTTGNILTLAATLAISPSILSEAAVADTVVKYLAFINDKVNIAITGQIRVAGSVAHHGNIPGVGGITGGFQFQDKVYGVRDYYSVGFKTGTSELFVGDGIAVIPASGDTIVGLIAGIVLTDGAWVTGDAVGYINIQAIDRELDWASGDSYTIHQIVPHNDVVYVCIDTHTAADSTEPGIGVNYVGKWDLQDVDNWSLIVTDDAIHKQFNTTTASAIVDTDNVSYKGGLWKATAGGWLAIDTGYSLEFNTGEVAPNIRDAPLFVGNMLDAVEDAGAKNWGTPVSIGSSPFISWTAPGAGTTSDNSRATCSLSAEESSAELVGLINITSVPNSDVRILGIEVEIESVGTGAAASSVEILTVKLSSTATDWYLSDSRSDASTIPDPESTITFGGSTDLWGVDTISAQDIMDGKISVLLQYVNTHGSNTASAEVDNVTVKVYYVSEISQVYIYDGSSDVSEAAITAWQITNGGYTWGSALKPAGVFTLYNVDDPPAIKPGMAIRTGASGGGSLIATVANSPRYNSLPSEAELVTTDSQYESIVANFFADAGAEAVYVVTGAGAAFAYNGKFFSYIRTPLLDSADKPRHVHFHVNMLALGYETGHVLISTVGAPHDFSSAQGGTSWGFRDAITGLQALPGATLAVLSKSSTSTLTGADPGSMSQKNIQPNSGAKEYTLQQGIDTLFMDFYGISTLSITDRFGDFNFGRITKDISPWLKDRLQEARATETVQRTVVASVSIRNKNQYRLYFEDGYILTTSMLPDRPAEFTWQHYDTSNFSNTYVPTFIDSAVLSTGRERAIMGTADGSMWIIDGANGIQTGSGLTTMTSYIVTNPINLDKPEAVAKYHHVMIQGQFYGWQQIEGWSDSNYVFTESGSAQETINIGTSSDTPLIDSINNIDSIYLQQLADGYSLKLQTAVDGSKPHTLQSLIFRASIKGTDRNRTPTAY